MLSWRMAGQMDRRQRARGERKQYLTIETPTPPLVPPQLRGSEPSASAAEAYLGSQHLVFIPCSMRNLGRSKRFQHRRVKQSYLGILPTHTSWTRITASSLRGGSLEKGCWKSLSSTWLFLGFGTGVRTILSRGGFFGGLNLTSGLKYLLSLSGYILMAWPHALVGACSMLEVAAGSGNARCSRQQSDGEQLFGLLALCL